METKSLTADRLVDTEIGKKLSMVKDDHPDDVEFVGEIKLFKELLKRNGRAYKPKKRRKRHKNRLETRNDKAPIQR